MNPEEEKTIPVQAADTVSGQTEPESAGSTDTTGTDTTSDIPAADMSAAQAASGSLQTAGQGYQQNPGAQLNGYQGYQQNPNAQFNNAQGYQQNPNAQFNNAQGYQQNPNAQFNNAQGYQQNPNAQFNNAQGYQQNPNAQFNNAQGYQQNPNAQFNNAQGYQQNPNAQFGGAQSFTQGFQNMTGGNGNTAYGAGTNQPNSQYYNGQNYQQNPYYVNSASIPPAAAPKKKSKKMIWIPIVSVVLVAAIAVGIYFLVSKKTHDPQEVISTAMANTFAAERTETATGWLQSQNLSTLAQGDSYQVNSDITIDKLSGSLADDISMLEGIGITSSAALDMNAARYAGSGSILYNGTSYIDYEIYAYDDYMAIACPSLFEGYLEFKTSSFGMDFNNSPLAEALDTQLDPTLAFQFFELFSTAQEAETEVPREFQEFFDSIRYEEGDKKDLQVNGKNQTCQGYRIVVPHESLEDLLHYFCEYMGELGTPVDYAEIAPILPREDFVMNVYVDNKGRMARFSFSLPIEAAQTELNCQIDFTGLGDNPADHVTGSFTLNVDGYSYGLSFESTTNTSDAVTTQNTTISVDVSGISVANATYVSTFDTQTKTAHADLSVSAMYTSILSMNMDYSYTDIVPGERFTLNIDDMTFDIAGELTVGLSGSTTISKLSGPVSEPSGTKYDLFTMTEDDFTTLTSEIYHNIIEGPIGSLIMEYYQLDDYLPYGETDW